MSYKKMYSGENTNEVLEPTNEEIAAAVSEEVDSSFEEIIEKKEMSREAEANKENTATSLKEKLGNYLQTIAQNETVKKIAMSPALPCLAAIAGGALVFYGLNMAETGGAAGGLLHNFLDQHLNSSVVAQNEQLFHQVNQNIPQYFDRLTPFIYSDNGTAMTFDQLMEAHPDMAALDKIQEKNMASSLVAGAGLVISVLGFGWLRILTITIKSKLINKLLYYGKQSKYSIYFKQNLFNP